jgi:hypothetical protein
MDKCFWERNMSHQGYSLPTVAMLVHLCPHTHDFSIPTPIQYGPLKCQPVLSSCPSWIILLYLAHVFNMPWPIQRVFFSHFFMFLKNKNVDLKGSLFLGSHNSCSLFLLAQATFYFPTKFHGSERATSRQPAYITHSTMTLLTSILHFPSKHWYQPTAPHGVTPSNLNLNTNCHETQIYTNTLISIPDMRLWVNYDRTTLHTL